MRGRQSSTSSWPHHGIWLRRHLTLSLFSSGCQSMFFFLFSFSKMMPLVYAEYVCIEHNMSWIAVTGTVILWIKSAIFSVVMQVGILRLYRKCRNCRLIHVATFISLFSWSCQIMIKYYLVHFWKEKKRKNLQENMRNTSSAECQRKHCVLSNETVERRRQREGKRSNQSQFWWHFLTFTS